MHLMTEPVKSSPVSPAAGVAAEAPAGEASPITTEGSFVYATDGAALPRRCVVCGDSLELVAFHTVRGHVRYWVCREHRIEAIGKLAGGAAMVLIALWQLLGPVLEGARPTGTTLSYFVPILLAGVALSVLAVPVHAGRSQAGRRRLYGAGRVLRAPANAVR